MKHTNIIIAFSTRTRKGSARLFCRKFKHCCVIFNTDRGHFLVQVAADGVRLFPLAARGFRLLEQDGWVCVRTGIRPTRQFGPQFLSCVGFAKRVIGLRDPFVWTPDQLYRRISRGRVC